MKVQQQLLTELYDKIQGVGGDMFNPAKKLTKADAIKRIYNIEIIIQNYKEAMYWLIVIELAEKGSEEEQETLRVENEIRAEAGEPTVQEEINKLVEAGRKKAEE